MSGAENVLSTSKSRRLKVPSRISRTAHSPNARRNRPCGRASAAITTARPIQGNRSATSTTNGRRFRVGRALALTRTTCDPVAQQVCPRAPWPALRLLHIPLVLGQGMLSLLSQVAPVGVASRAAVADSPVPPPPVSVSAPLAAGQHVVPERPGELIAPRVAEERVVAGRVGDHVVAVAAVVLVVAALTEQPVVAGRRRRGSRHPRRSRPFRCRRTADQRRPRRTAGRPPRRRRHGRRRHRRK